MKCPSCLSSVDRVTDSRDHTDYIRRRRECLGCGHRFTTHEAIASESLEVRLNTIESRIDTIGAFLLAGILGDRVERARALADMVGLAHYALCAAVGLGPTSITPDKRISEDTLVAMEKFAAEVALGKRSCAVAEPCGERPIDSTDPDACESPK